MKRKIVFLTALALMLCACGAAKEDVPAQTDATTTALAATAAQTTSPSPAAQTQALQGQIEQSYDDGEIDFSVKADFIAPWQAAYIELLEQICEEEAPFRRAGEFDYETMPDPSDSYGLHDIDKDGVPELIIKHGTCEADYYAEVFTYQKDGAASLGTFPFGHAALYSCPGENAMLFDWGHMGYHEAQKITIQNAEIAFLDVLLEEDLNDTDKDYTPANEIVPGAKYIDFNRTTLNLPDIVPLTLPIYTYGLVQGEGYPTGGPSQQAREAIAQVIMGEGELYGVSGDGFEGDTGKMTFQEYRQPGVAARYAKRPMTPTIFVWFDLNRDGREECVLRLQEEEEGEASANNLTVVLSLQDGVVYAYAFSFIDEMPLGEDGLFSHQSDLYPWGYRIFFYKNQCYKAYLEPDDFAGPVAWETYDASLF